MKTPRLNVLVMAVALSAAFPFAATADDKAPMPQTRGMQGMDPRLHDQPAVDPYKGCTPNAEKVAQQEKYPMPQTRGMQGMDSKAHTVDCPPASTEAGEDVKKQQHVHRGPGKS